MKSNQLTNVLISLILVIAGCASPKKSLEKGHYVLTLQQATKNISKGKDVGLNEEYLKAAARAIAEQTLADHNHYKDSDDIKQWKTSQSRFNNALTDIGKYNIKTNGLISESYNLLCDAKYEIDLTIVDYYHQEGLALLDKSINTEETVWARQAYQEFIKSEKEGGQEFYNNLDALKEECIIHGSIVIKAPSQFNLNNRFFRRWNPDGGDKPDCTITTDIGFIDISETSETSQNQLTKSVVVGQNAVTDTSGVVRYEDIYQDVIGYENIEDITITARQQLYISVQPNSAECYIESHTKYIEISDSCEEITYTGDSRATVGKFNSTCNTSFIRNKLQREVSDDIRYSMFVN